MQLAEATTNENTADCIVERLSHVLAMQQAMQQTCTEEAIQNMILQEKQYKFKSLYSINKSETSDKYY